jgi:hypothetical protein
MWVTDEVKSHKYEFVVYLVASREPVSQGSIKYTLRLCSPEMYVDSYTRVSKAYSRVLYEDSIRDFLGYLDSKKELIAGPTIEPKNFIVPSWPAIKACNWVASRAQSLNSEYGGGNYVFFETHRGFEFAALDNYYDARANAVYATVSFDPLRKSVDQMTTYDRRIPDDTLRFEEFPSVISTDHMANSALGMYANRIHFVDVHSREAQDVDYSYVKDFRLGKHMGGGLTNDSSPLTRETDPALASPEAQQRVYLSHRGLFSEDSDEGDGSRTWGGRRLSQLQQTEQFVIRGSLPGHLGMRAGMLVDFSYPDIRDRSITSEYRRDPRYSGHYMVSAVRRSFARERMTLAVEMYRDSIAIGLDGTVV